MSDARPASYLAPSRDIAPGAVFLHVPIPYPPDRLLAAGVIAGGLLQVEQDVDRAWQTASPRIREVGVPVLGLAKSRPVVVLSVGAAEEDTWHRAGVWVAPRYTRKEYRAPRRGRNVFDLPSAPQVSLDEDGFLDFFQVLSIPLSYLQPRYHRCDLSPAAFDALVAAFSACILP